MNQPLTWALVVATYQREKILPQCLKLAVKQTRQPVEIIVVDASDNWETTRDKVMSEIAATVPHIRWVYVQANQRGLPLQRNQGLDLVTADIVFLLDDDSLMYPTCAEEIMKVYEADVDHQVMGVEASLADAIPSADMAVEDTTKPIGWKQDLQRVGFTGLKQFVWSQILLMSCEVTCVPYQGSFPDYDMPPTLAHLNLYRQKIFHGCRMTYRREVIVRERFEPLLLYYALNEDMDASYRVSCHGMLVEALDAKLHHFQSNSGRLSRYKVTTLSALNQAVCLKRYSNNLARDQVRFYVLALRRIFSEFCKDGLSRRWTFPQLRGVFMSLWYAPTIFRLSPDQLAEWYPQFQQWFVETGNVPKANQAVRVEAAEV